MNFKNYKKIVLLTSIVAFLVLPMVVFAQTSQGSSGTGEFFSYFLAPIASFFLSLSASLLTFSVSMLDVALRLPVDVEIVRGVWGIIRDFANMFFILALVVMALATILDLESFGFPGYDWRQMLGRFVFAALTINFSLAIGQVVISASQILTNVFLNSIGDVSARMLEIIAPLNTGVTETGGSTISSILSYIGVPLSALNLVSTITAAGFGTSNLTIPTITKMFMSSFIMMTMAFSMITPVVFAFVRIPYLWFLLIISPLAWISYVFPRFRSAYSKWWDHFLGWNLFLPSFLFFLYLGLYILTRQQEVLVALFPNNNTQISQAITLGLGYTVQDIFFYIVVLGVFWGGTAMALKSSFSAGQIATSSNAGNWVSGWINRRTGIVGGAQKRFDQLKKEGLQTKIPFTNVKVYGGEEAVKERESRWAARLGVRGGGKDLAQLQVDKINREYKVIEDRFDKGLLTKDEVIKQSTNYKLDDPRGIAHKKLMLERGLVPKEQYGNIFKDYGDNPYLIEELSKSAEEGKFGEADADTLLNIATYKAGTGTIVKDGVEKEFKYDYRFLGQSGNFTSLRRRAFKKVITDARSVGKVTFEDFKEAIELAGGPRTKEGGELIKSMSELNPAMTIKYTLETPGANPQKFDISQLWDNAINTSYKKIATMTLSTWENPMFQKKLKAKLENAKEDIKKRADKLSELQEEILDHPDKSSKAKILDEEIRSGTDVDKYIQIRSARAKAGKDVID
mgnify:CR=1 FL=1